jgi:signal transduction histidine kinase
MSLSDTGLRRLVWVVFGLELLGIAVSFLLDRASGVYGDYVFAAMIFTFPVVGAIVLRRRPRNTLGWLMLSMGIVFALPFESYGNYALSARNGDLPGGAVALALSAPTWVPFIGISGFLLLLFPDGHLLSQRWRWFGWTCGVGLVLLTFAILWSPGPMTEIGYPQIDNPLGIEALGPWVFALVVFAPLTVVGGAVAIVRRLRRTSDAVQREQLRWLAWASAIMAVLYVLAFVPQAVLGSGASGWGDVVGLIAVFSFVLIPITIGFAVLRYHLYDIDVVIRKTVVFAILAGSITVVYVALAAGIGVFVGSHSREIGVGAAAVAAAIVGSAFQPLSRWARRVANRIVYGDRATPYEVLATFGDQLGGTYASDDVLPRIARVLAEGVGASVARVWLRVGDDLRLVAAWPADGGEVPDDYATSVQHQGEPLGALSVAMPASDPMDPPKEKLVRDLAAQLGLVLRNERLTEELRSKLVELQAAQKRLVSAQDHERRRLERNIHDGAQQQLVALTVKARLARQLTEREPAKAAEMLTQIEAETQTALEDLRDLARGIYPPLLADKGLVAALEAQARRSPVPTVIDAGDLGRPPQDIEAAVYFSTLEALQNVGKYARASTAMIRLRIVDGVLSFTVNDDGRGFDPSTTGYGTGLQGIADRIGALDGSLIVTSQVGAGTTIAGRLPLNVEAGRVRGEHAPGSVEPEGEDRGVGGHMEIASTPADVDARGQVSPA